jgi:hypothetical protein
MANIPPADLGFIQEALHDVTQELLEAFDDASMPITAPHSATPAVLAKSLEQLLILFANPKAGKLEFITEDEPAFLGQDIRALGHYGMSLFAALTDWARVMHVSRPHDELRRLGFGFGLWLARNEIEIVLLAPLVDNLAFVANDLNHAADFIQMYAATSQIMDAVSPALTQQNDNKRVKPWNLLVLHRAKIAIQSRQPPLMEQAFESLVELLPEEAPNFFQDSVVQMETAQYPEATRAVVEKYFRLWCVPQTLH